MSIDAKPQVIDDPANANHRNAARDLNPDMRINVARLLKHSPGTARWYDLSAEIQGIDADLKIESPLTGHLKMIRTTEGVLVTGSLQTTVELQCCRCLEPFLAPIELEVEEEFHPSVDIRTGAALPVTDADEEATTIDEHHVLDLTEIVRQAIFLALPMHPLCQRDCAGLCPQCGQNLNMGQCECSTEAVDPRLEVLRQLL
jgi:uncharacterized protein